MPAFFRILSLGLLALSCPPVAKADEVPPNIIVFLADDMGLGDTSAYQDWTGNADDVQVHTPNMQRLANRGVRFTDAHSPHSRCTTSRYALMTGRYCWRTRLKHWVLFGVQGDPLIEKDRPTIASFLREAGYQTGMVGKWHLGLSYTRSDGGTADAWDDADLTRPLADGPLDHGFQMFLGFSRSHPTSGPNGSMRNTPDQRIGPGWIDDRQIAGATGNGKQLDGSYVLKEIGPRLNRRSAEFIRKANAEQKPFFLYFASQANHLAHTPCEAINGVKVAGASRFVNGEPTGRKRLDFINENDVQIGQLLKLLEEPDPRRPGRPLIENTFFVFASDNGAEVPGKTATGPLRSNKGSVYEGGHRIPFIASWPAGNIGDGNPETPGKTVNRLLALNDLFATFAEILHRPLPNLADGERGAEDSHSQLAAMQGEPAPARAVLFSNDHKQASKELSDQRAWVAVRSNACPIPGQWKLFLDDRYAFEGKIQPKELYNLQNDLKEQNNRVEDPAARPALEFLLEQARAAAGEEGRTRQQEAKKPAADARAKTRPNVITVFIDDMGWSDLSCFGGEDVKTENIDRLASEGLRFTNFYVNSPICSPSRVALTTGQYPQRWRITSYLAHRQLNDDRGVAQWLDPKAPTLARALQQAGYAAGHFGKWHMGGQRDVGEAPLIQDYGFEKSLTNFEGLGARVLPLKDAYDGKPPGKHDLGSADLGRGPIVWKDRSIITSAFVEEAIGFIDQAQSQKRPFYVNLWPDDVHSPFFPPETLRKQTDGSKRALYLAVLKAMDEQLGPLFNRVRNDPALRNNTLIFLASDNGPEPGAGRSNPLRGVKGFLYEGGVRSPLIVWGPGFIDPSVQGTINKTSVLSAVDLNRSLYELTGTMLPKDARPDGENLAQTLLGKETKSREAPIFWRRPPDRPGPKGNQNPDLAVRDGRWKFTIQYNGRRPQLYDLNADAGETRNLAADHPEVVERLKRLVFEWNSELPVDAGDPKFTPKAGPAVK